MVKPEITGIRQFSQKVSRYLRSTRPVIVTKRGRPYRLLRPIAAQEVQALAEHAGMRNIVQHQAIGVWKRRWTSRQSATAVVQRWREQEGRRALRHK